jgi:hypothetical protein
VTSIGRLLQLDHHDIAKNRERLVFPVGVNLPSPAFANGVTAKLDDVTRILSELKADLDAKKLSVERTLPSTIYQCHALIDRIERRKLLEQLKVYGRSVDNSDPIFTEDVRYTTP